MQPGSHGRLAYDIRAQVPGLKTYGSHASDGYFRKGELQLIARHLGISYMDLRDEVREEFGETRVRNRHYRWAICREAGCNMTIKGHPRDYDESFSKGQKRSVLQAVKEADEE